METNNILEVAVKAADLKQASDIVLINIEKISVITDNFLIMSAPSSRQMLAISNEIKDELAKKNIYPLVIEGENKNLSEWILIKFETFIVHIFKSDIRNKYNLEDVWQKGEIKDVNKWIEN